MDHGSVIKGLTKAAGTLLSTALPAHFLLREIQWRGVSVPASEWLTSTS
jgi:hypothetical protein